MSINRTNNPSNSWAAGAPHHPEIFGVTPSTPVPTFRPPNTPRTVGEETALKSYTRKRIAFTSIPFNIRSLFTKVEARIYLKDVSLAHLAMSKQSELSLYLIEYHTHAFIHKQKQAVLESACKMLTPMMLTHTPSYTGSIKDEIESAFFYSLPNAKRKQI